MIWGEGKFVDFFVWMSRTWTACSPREEVTRHVGTGPWSWKCEFATPTSLILWLKSRKISLNSLFCLENVKKKKNVMTLMKINKSQVYWICFLVQYFNGYFLFFIIIFWPTPSSLSVISGIRLCAAGTRPRLAHSLAVVGPRSAHVTQESLAFFTFGQAERALPSGIYHVMS